ncbi:hypothetical protein GF359_02655 [candidate division WOR-3 bacterium]|uniref:HEPN domain-containing protein n=1 Tax=candidate division WOR-3 bacterium TaxID=2052148 RepID=A0A9D5QDI9_UNCW3|nr:hypothetical protein [candidate division WOR-3 bacterium]MBD3364095.1 hypothetical protein [candidate division WOR-3 bacterium]
MAKSLGGDSKANPSQEAKLRSAVSRSYFAVYCYSRNLAIKYLEFAPTHSVYDHKNLREHLKQHSKASVARWLGDLRRFRDDCDYDDRVPNLQGVMIKSLECAEKVFEELT